MTGVFETRQVFPPAYECSHENPTGLFDQGGFPDRNNGLIFRWTSLCRVDIAIYIAFGLVGLGVTSALIVFIMAWTVAPGCTSLQKNSQVVSNINLGSDHMIKCSNVNYHWNSFNVVPMGKSATAFLKKLVVVLSCP